MTVPIICLDARLRQFCETFRKCFSKPQYKYLVTVLLALMLCQETHTLSGLLRQVAAGQSVSGLSRFLSQSPWSATEVAGAWIERFHEQLAAAVAAEHERQRRQRPKRAGRPRKTVVTGYLIGDDSTQHKPKGKEMGGLGRHHATSHDGRVTGHSLMQSLYVLLGRQCPLAPQMYRQQAVCEREGVPFQSKIDLMETTIRDFEPLPDTATHVLVDSWFGCKRIWRAARERGFRITAGRRCNRSLRIADPQAEGGKRWQRLDEYAASLSADQYHKVVWPSQDGQREVYVHVVRTRIRKLYTCQLVIARYALDCPLKAVRYWASSDLDADLPTLLHHIATRWTIEVLFSDAKDLLGLDQYQLMDATAILRFWTLVMAAFAFLDEERARLRDERQAHVTLGDARRDVQRSHWHHALDWIHQQFSSGVTPDELHSLLVA
jgi:SRSO17 transposase